MISRRQFVHVSALALAGCRTVGDVRDGNPFRLGIASGDPTANSVILWTRLAPDLQAENRLGDRVAVTWTIARDPQLSEVVNSGTVDALPENAYAVHVDATALEPGSTYYYRFGSDGYSSRLGRTRTLPAPGAAIDRFTIGLVSCQEFSSGWFTAYRDLVRQQPDVVVFNGDYIYESASGSARPDPIGHEAKTLADYRALYAQYRQDEDLAEAHAQFPWFVIWDDHEVVNDWGPDHYLPSAWNDSVGPAAHRARVRAATRAFLEHMPIRAAITSQSHGRPTLYSQSVIGDLIEISHLDVRSFRDPPVCNDGDGLNFPDCADAKEPQRSMLGRQQESWLLRQFGSAGCRWNCLSQATVMAAFDRVAGPEVLYESDSWDSYAANRERILQQVAEDDIRNAVSLGGNIHAFYAGVIAADNACNSPVMSELVTSSVSAGGGDSGRRDDVLGRLDENPCIRYFENRYRGYMLLEFNRQRLLATLRIADSIASRHSQFETLARLTVRSGQPGIQINR